MCVAPLTDEGRTFASSLYTAATENLVREFGCLREVVTLGLSLFVVGLGVGPMVSPQFLPQGELSGGSCCYLALFWLTSPVQVLSPLSEVRTDGWSHGVPLQFPITVHLDYH